MPPALSDSESSYDDDSVVLLREKVKAATKSIPDDVSDSNNNGAPATNVDSAASGSEQDDEEDLDDDVFIVEAIKKHIIDEDGTLKFQVKWEGYESKQDLTWEPEDNLRESASDILNEYLRERGGRDAVFDETDQAAKTKKRRKKNNRTPVNTKRSRKNGTHPAETTPPVSAKQWSPPAGSWEDEIETIDACEEGYGELVVYLIWKNGQKTKHNTSTIYKKCPQKMLHFYERHVKIIRDDTKALADV